jgi:hypothetical protein
VKSVVFFPRLLLTALVHSLQVVLVQALTASQVALLLAVLLQVSTQF